MERMPEGQQIPKASRDGADEPGREDIARRPRLPEHPRRMPADGEGDQE